MNSPQLNSNHEEHNWINNSIEPTATATDLHIADPTDMDIADSTDMNGEAKEDHLQSRSNMSIKAWQEQEETIEDLPATNKQNRSLLHGYQTTEQADLPSLMDLIHGPRSQGPRTMLIVLTESTISAARSPTRQFL